jgi:hypothetical protein
MANNRESLLRPQKVAENRGLQGRQSCPRLPGACFDTRNESFSLFFLFEQGSGPSSPLAETGSRKLALFGGNRRTRSGVHSGSAPLNPPFAEP